MVYVFCLLLAIGIPVGVWITKSHFEAKIYSELTGKQVSTWQALWVQLRVIEPAKP